MQHLVKGLSVTGQVEMASDRPVSFNDRMQYVIEIQCKLNKQSNQLPFERNHFTLRIKLSKCISIHSDAMFKCSLFMHHAK